MKSAWQQGADAARNGGHILDCPHGADSWDSVTWTNGYATARHNMAVEAAKRGDKPAEPFYKRLLPGLCPECKAPVFDTTSGVVCGSGHGGIEPVVTPVDDDLFGDDNSDLF